MLSEGRTLPDISCLDWRFADRALWLSLPRLVAHLLFCREELRRRFVKAETTLFRVRYINTTISERREFHQSGDFDWTLVSPISRGTCSV